MKRLLQWRTAAALVMALAAWLWMRDEGPPRTLVAWFDSAYEADFPLAGGHVLQLEAVDHAALLTAVTARARGLGTVDDTPARVNVTPLDDDDAGREALERALTAAQGQLEVLPVIDEPARREAFATWMRDHAELGEPRGDLARAASRAQLEAILAQAMRECEACRPGPAEAFALEARSERDDSGQAAGSEWIAYVVSRATPIFDQRFVVDAEVTFDESNQPAIIVNLDEQGTKRFATLTADHIDDKLAIVVDGVVMSAPIVRSAITGGQIMISMGDADESNRASLEHARVLAAALRPGVALPAMTTWRWLDHPGASDGAILGAELLVVLLAALLGWLVLAFGWLGLEHAPTTTIAAGSARGVPVRLFVTLGLGAAAVLATRLVPLPLPESRLADGAVVFDAHLALFSLGLTPVLFAYLLVALVTLLPPLKHLRGGHLAARRALLPAIISLTLVLALVLSFGTLFIARTAMDLDLSGPSLALAVATLTAGTFALWGVAALISRFGVGNGFVVILFAKAAVAAWLPTTTLIAAWLVLGLITLRLACARIDGRRLPFAGFVPVDLGVALSQLALIVGAFVVFPGLAPDALVAGLVSVALALVIGAVYGRAVGAAKRVPALVVGAVLVLALALFPDWRGAPLGVAGFAALVALPVVVADLGAELAAHWRRGPLVRVASTHDVARADGWLDALRAAGITAACRATRLRALARFMAPWLPIEVWVPTALRGNAEATLAAYDNAAMIGPFGE